MEYVYKAKIFDLNDLAFKENLQIHLRKLNKSIDKLSALYKGVLPRIKSIEPAKAYKIVKTNLKKIKAIKKPIVAFLSITPIPDYYLMLFDVHVKDLKEFISICKDCVGIVKDRIKKYKITHLKYVGKSPVIVNIGINSFYNSKGKQKSNDRELNAFLKSNLKNGGLMIFNSVGSYRKCEKFIDKYSANQVCISAANGAYVSVPDGRGGQLVLQDKRIPVETANAIFNFFNKPENQTLLANYYMVVESNSEKPSIFDISSGKWKKVAGNYDNGETNFKYALSRAYNIRFVPKVSSFSVKNAVQKGKTVTEKMQNCSNVFNNLANDMAKNLLEMPQDLLNQLDKDVDIQMGKNGSICLVPKGCSKMQAAEQIANAYNIPTKQILTLATSICDVCDSVSFNELQSYFAKNPEASIVDCFKLNTALLADSNKFAIPDLYIKTPDIYNLQLKINKDFVTINKKIFDEQISQERKSFIENIKPAFDQELENYKKQMEDLRIQPSTNENKQKMLEINQKAQIVKQRYGEMLDQFEDYVSKKQMEEIYNKFNYNITHYSNLSRKFVALSKNFVPAPKTNKEKGPSITM